MFLYFWSLLHLVARSFTLDFYMDATPVAGTLLANLWITIIFLDLCLLAVVFVVVHYIKEMMFYSSC